MRNFTKSKKQNLQIITNNNPIPIRNEINFVITSFDIGENDINSINNFLNPNVNLENNNFSEDFNLENFKSSLSSEEQSKDWSKFHEPFTKENAFNFIQDKNKNKENKKSKGIIRQQKSMIIKTFKNTLNDNNQLFNRPNKRTKTVSFRKEQNSLSINEKSSNNESIQKNTKINSKYNALIILSNNLLIPNEEKLKLKYLNKKLYNKIVIPYIFSESILKLKDEFENANKSINESDSIFQENLVELHKSTFPSKTSQSGINFITKKKEELIYSDSSDLGKELCNLLYIILNLEDKFDNKKSLKDLFKYLFDTYKISNIKDLFFKILYPKIYIDNDINKGLYNTLNKRILNNLSEIKLICKTRNSPLSWIAINILEFDKYFEMIYKSEIFD